MNFPSARQSQPLPSGLASGALSTLAVRLIAMAAVLTLVACGKPPSSSDFAVRDFGKGEISAKCAENNPLRNAYFGDLHVHTALSTDAWMFGVRVSPESAYRYAFGGSVSLPVDGSTAVRRVSNPRPLDFMAVTDHAEFLGENLICNDPKAKGWDSDFCTSLRHSVGRSRSQILRITLPFSRRDKEVCGDGDQRCIAASGRAWQQTIDAAERWQDRSDRCERSSFIAYEYSSHRLGSNLHRNVIFRNTRVPQRPISYLEAKREWTLWALLRDACLDSGKGCDVLAIPHNSNISNGRMFAVDYPATANLGERRQRAQLRARLEPLVEIFQHKGDSECRQSMPGILGEDDPWCGFERFEDMSYQMRFDKPLDNTCYSGPLADWVPHLGPDCLSPMSFVRYALIEGLRQQQILGVNPYRFGLLGSTDTHNGLGGGTDERSYPGHLGVGDDSPEKRLAMDSSVAGNYANNPGGLIGVWAEENSRESIFAALRRREVFGTSGTRIRTRLFAGWGLTQDLCTEPEFSASAYRNGVPMGGVLSRPNADGRTAAPLFLAWALADPLQLQRGVGLERIQIVKGWVDDQGELQQRVYAVAGARDDKQPDQAVASCEVPAAKERSYSELCTTWRDPDFDPRRPAVYYARILEQPSCRYTAWECASLPPDQAPAGCRDGSLNTTIQERAWSSPIWYQPSQSKQTAGAQPGSAGSPAKAFRESRSASDMRSDRRVFADQRRR